MATSRSTPSSAPFVWVALFWMTAVSSLSLGYLFDGQQVAIWTLMIGGLSFLNMAALWKTVQLATEPGQTPGLSVYFWASLKLICLGVLGYSLWLGRNESFLGICLGLATLIIVPLVGGYWSNHRDLSHA